MMYDVPPGSRSSKCTGETCTARIYWIKTEKGGRMPVDCEVDGGFAPSDHEPGRGVSHFTTCPDVRQFSGRNRT